ncbi:uncharacterized protein LOC120008757 [Tripterygium wilfordii]|uniref:uncharacterized protein LOC120008757 n=1 Tax=Tripterygium wilfordii TaxID=458696 RepID=UPI0018F810F1|nr:uncharacterized protein LOC120008757 [Tripterygium wilfordii]
MSAKTYSIQKREGDEVSSVADFMADFVADFTPSIEAQTNKPQMIPVRHLEVPTTEDVDKVLAIATEDNWMTPLIKYIDKGELPLDKNAARRLRARVVRFTLFEGQLYRKSYSGPLLRCVTTRQGGDILSELHEGEYGNHSGGRILANRTLTTGYFWPTIRADAANFVLLCDKCQRFTQVSHLHPEKLHPTLAPWPLMHWGMDTVGKLPITSGQ